MSYNLRTEDRDQLLLMPPSLEDWLEEGHLARTVLAVVDEFDLDGFYASLRQDGRGGASYDPATMVSVILYAYCVGIRSSRKIEQHCGGDVAFRYICANQIPDHATLARFVVRHEEVLGTLFSQMLHLCHKAGMVDTSILALDGTKMAADASIDANRPTEEIARRIIHEAIENDEDEDECFGMNRGDEIPEKLRDPEWLRRGLKDIETEREKSLETKPNRELAESKINLTDPDSRVMRTREGKRPAYNAQAVVSADQVIVAADVTQQSPDSHQLEPMAQQGARNLAELQKTPTTLVADTGYWKPVAVAGSPFATTLINLPSPTSDALDQVTADLATIGQLFKDALEKKIKQTEAADKLGVTRAVFRNAFKLYKDNPEAALSSYRMHKRLSDADNKALLARRKAIVEPVFGQIKHNRGIRRMRRRGLKAATTEWSLIATTHNLGKYWRKITTTGTTPSPSVAL